ncbi:MAG: ATP-binding protein, partial [Gemmatimonadetes bacterium]|nr:ATP-binding protein [Gemmatimonadota bacterium]
HWRPRAGIQREDQFSDGTLRLIGMLWALLEGESMLFLEEPELCLHPGIVNRLAALILRMQRNTGRQVLVSTHSAALLSDPDIEPEEVLLLKPVHEGSAAEVAGDVTDALLLLDRDVDEERTPRERTLEKDPNQMSLFE